MKTNFSVYIPGTTAPAAANSLRLAMQDLDIGVPYAEMMRHRINGHAVGDCNDVYYICTDEDNNLISRLWMGWGKHNRAVGNWGNFFTAPEYRGQGIGRQMLDFWCEDLKKTDNLPLALFCTAGTERLTELYRPYGFRPALKNATCGPLYRPLGNSPESFEDFCKQYYTPAKSLVFKPATLEWRHEIDCLFKFAMLNMGLDYLPDGMISLESSLLANADNTEIIFTDTNIPVGIAHTSEQGKQNLTLHPLYLHLL